MCQNCLRGSRDCVHGNDGIKFVIHSTDPPSTHRSVTAEQLQYLQLPAASQNLQLPFLVSEEWEESAIRDIVISDPRSALSNPDVSKIFRHYVDQLAPWYDLNDAESCFGIIVPQHALDNPLLFKALVAFSAHHLSIVTGEVCGLGLAFHAACVEDLLAVMDNFQLRLRADYLAAACLLRSYEILAGMVLLISCHDKHAKANNR